MKIKVHILFLHIFLIS